MKKWKEYQRMLSSGRGCVVSQQNTAHQEQLSKQKTYVKTLAEVTLLLGKLGLPFHGHDESSTSDNQGIPT